MLRDPKRAASSPVGWLGELNASYIPGKLKVRSPHSLPEIGKSRNHPSRPAGSEKAMSGSGEPKVAANWPPLAHCRRRSKYASVCFRDSWATSLTL